MWRISPFSLTFSKKLCCFRQKPRAAHRKIVSVFARTREKPFSVENRKYISTFWINDWEWLKDCFPGAKSWGQVLGPTGTILHLTLSSIHYLEPFKNTVSNILRQLLINFHSVNLYRLYKLGPTFLPSGLLKYFFLAWILKNRVFREIEHAKLILRIPQLGTWQMCFFPLFGDEIHHLREPGFDLLSP